MEWVTAVIELIFFNFWRNILEKIMEKMLWYKTCPDNRQWKWWDLLQCVKYDIKFQNDKLIIKRMWVIVAVDAPESRLGAGLGLGETHTTVSEIKFSVEFADEDVS